MLPSFRLYEREKAVTALYPKTMETFLDIGCCRGYFVLEAAGRPHCRVAAGIDVHQPFVSTCVQVGRHMGIPNVRFYLADVDDVWREPERYGGPFQVVVMLGTYHYLYWGSQLHPNAYHSHREILLRVSRLCAGKLIFSARLEVDRLPGSLREEARTAGNGSAYSIARFLDAAEKFFDIREAGHIGRDPLLLMSKRKAQFREN